MCNMRVFEITFSGLKPNGDYTYTARTDATIIAKRTLHVTLRKRVFKSSFTGHVLGLWLSMDVCMAVRAFGVLAFARME